MQLVRRARQLTVYATFILAYSVIIAPAQDRFVPARYRDGALPQIPIQALGGGEVLLELTVSVSGVVTAARTLRATPPFTDPMVQAVRGWRFVPAEKEKRPVDSKVLVASLFRPPALETPTFGEPPQDVATPSDETPFSVATVMPPYPPLARDTGVVLVEVGVGLRGEVVDARVIRRAPPFDEPALEAARRWRFRPARVDGQPVETFAYIVFAFRQPVTVLPKKSSE